MPAYDHSSQVAELTSRIAAIRYAMFTTIDQHGHLVSCPMTNQHTDPEGNLWFFTSTVSPLWEQIAAHPQVNLSFVDPERSIYVSVNGQAERVVDRARIKGLWNTEAQAWFPDGPDDLHAMLVCVRSQTAEYWDAKVNAMVELFKVLTGGKPEDGKHGHLDL
ncbi:MAG: pyridoxamine 5'-phosphate oxidase family protein [Pseudomonadota bacterium]